MLLNKLRKAFIHWRFISVMEAILDTNFILSCLRKNIDLVNELSNMGFRIVVPREVLEELKDLRLGRTSRENRLLIDIALEILKDKKIKRIKLGTKSVDEGLIKKGREGVYIASLDNAIKREVANKIIISNARNGLEIKRD